MFSRMEVLYLFLALFMVVKIDAYKILVYSPTHSRSHMISNGRIADELAQAGHNVTLLEVEVVLKSSDLKSSKYANVVSLGGLDESLLSHGGAALTAQSFEENPPLFYNFKAYRQWLHAYNVLCDQFLELHQESLEKLKNEKFDLIFAEQLNLCGTGLKEVLDIKAHIWIASCPVMDHQAWILGMPTPLSYVPTVGDLSVLDKMSFRERFFNMIEFIGNVYVYRESIAETTKVFRKHYGPYFSDIEQLAKDSPITFVAADEILDFPRPIFHNTIYVGGLGVKNNAKGLKEPWTSELAKGQKGVVFFSLGSQTDTKRIPSEAKKNLFKVFTLLNEYHFIMKINDDDKESEDLAKDQPNIYLTKWAPQPDILAHPRLKAFITHGGYNSLTETAQSGVPIVTLPFFVDQWRNGRVAERNGWGISFDKRQLLHGHAKFYLALKKVLENPSYQENAKRTQKLIQTKPFSSSEKFIKWTEYVAANGGQLPELQIEGRNLSLITYYNLDIFAAILFLAVVVLFVVYRIIKTAYKLYVFIADTGVEKVKTQ